MPHFLCKCFGPHRRGEEVPNWVWQNSRRTIHSVRPENHAHVQSLRLGSWVRLTGMFEQFHPQRMHHRKGRLVLKAILAIPGPTRRRLNR